MRDPDKTLKQLKKALKNAEAELESAKSKLEKRKKKKRASEVQAQWKNHSKKAREDISFIEKKLKK